MKKTAEDIIRNHRVEVEKAVKESRDSEINDLFADIEKAGGVSYSRRLPLGLFEEHFLNFFMGKVKDPEEKTKLMNMWVDVSGHLGTPVNIVDNNDIEKVLFTIPPLRDGTLLDPNKAEAFEFALRQSQMHAVRSPTNAINYLIKNKDKIASNLLVDNIEEVYKERWKSFAIYYGLTKSDSETEQNVKNDGPANPEDDFDFGF